MPDEQRPLHERVIDAMTAEELAQALSQKLAGGGTSPEEEHGEFLRRILSGQDPNEKEADDDDE